MQTTTSSTHSYNQPFTSPEDMYGSLFADVQNSFVFQDSKTFADCIPLHDATYIIEQYYREKDGEDFDLSTFVLANFRVPSEIKSEFQPDPNDTTTEYILKLWPDLVRRPEDQESGGSLIPLPHPYVVPGGRFREIYYWDSYFTMLGLKESGRTDLIENMVENFAFLINKFGFIPTANRTYYLSRSQPPFFSLMVNLFSEIEGKKIIKKYLPQLRSEYDYWMSSGNSTAEDHTAHRRLVYLPDGVRLNRYWDDKASPRPEAYREDIELAIEAQKHLNKAPEDTFRDIRAAAESGWDFSSRWLETETDFASIKTTQLVPLDLNCLMYFLEKTLAEAYWLNEDHITSRDFDNLANQRCQAIQKYCWNADKNYFMDYDFRKKESSASISLAGAFPLFFKLATKPQSHYIRAYMRLNLLKSGGLLTTTIKSGQQWDAPNGWAPLQWIAYKGLRNYNFHRTANELRTNWIGLLDKEFRHSRKMLEKYNVADTNLIAGGGEYEIQEGFGWTNAVYLRLLSKRN